MAENKWADRVENPAYHVIYVFAILHIAQFSKTNYNKKEIFWDENRLECKRYVKYILSICLKDGGIYGQKGSNRDSGFW